MKPTLDDRLTGLIAISSASRWIKGEPEAFVASAVTADLKEYGLGHRAVSNGSGAGLDERAARGAAAGECVERYALGVIHDEDLVFGSHRDLAKRFPGMVHPSRWALYAPDQDMHEMPFSPFAEGTPLGWARGENLTRREEALVPASLAFMPYRRRFEAQGEQLLCGAVSTGAACATSRAEAIFKGLCECVERDGFMIAWRNRLPIAKIEIDEESELRDLYVERFARPGLEYALFDVTMDLEAACVFGLLIDHRCDPPTIMAGGARHPDPKVAVMKTLLELVQALKWIQFMGDVEIEAAPGFANIRDFEARVKLYAFTDMRKAVAPWMESGEVTRLSRMVSSDRRSVRGNLRRMLDVLRERGEEVLAVDLTTADAQECGLYVVRVVVPGLEGVEGNHLLPFLGGRRWREVPVRLGRRAVPLGLDEINPYPHPYP